MARDITITFGDGSSHVYRGAPDEATPEQVKARAEKEFGKTVTALDGGRAPAPEATSAALTEGRQLPGALRGLASVMQGPTLGFADELSGLVGGALSKVRGGDFGPAYERYRDLARGAAAQEQENNPMFTGITRMMAGAPLMAINPIGGAAGATTMLGRTGVAAGQGAAFGTVQGAGESTADTAGGVAVDALKSGAMSAALGGATNPALEVLGAAGRAGLSTVNKGMAERYAQQKVAEALLRDKPKGLTTPEAVIGRARSRLESLGPEARAVDAGGQNTRALLDTLATLPGQTKQATEQAIRSRQASRAGRMVGAMEDTLNPSGVRLAETVGDLIDQRKGAARPLYDKLYKTGVFIDDDLRGMISAAHELGAGAAGKRIATADQLEYGLTPATKWSGLRELDYLKQGLDDIIAANKTQTGELTKVGAHVQGLKGRFVSRLDELTKGTYKEARNAFAGPSALIDAAESGRKALNLDDMAIKGAMKGMTDSEAEAFRVGAAEALRAKLTTRSGQTQITELWREQGMQEKLKAIFGSERQYREFAAEVAKEARMKGLESTGRGSQTAARQFAAGDLDMSAVAGAAQAAGSLSSGNVSGVLPWVGQQWNRVATPEPVRDRMGQMLLGQGPVGQRGLLDAQKAMQEVQAAKLRNAGAYGLLGTFLAP